MDKDELRNYVDSKITELKKLNESDKDLVVEILKKVLRNYINIQPNESDSDLRKEVFNGIKKIMTETILNEINELNNYNSVYMGYNYLMIRGTLGGVHSVLEK